jgi:hypothetical protein
MRVIAIATENAVISITVSGAYKTTATTLESNIVYLHGNSVDGDDNMTSSQTASNFLTISTGKLELYLLKLIHSNFG